MNAVQIDYYKKSNEGYLSNEKFDHFILDMDEKLSDGFYITFDNSIIKDKQQCKICTISTKAKLASDFDTKMIKKFIDKLLLSDYNIPYAHALLRNYKGEFLKTLLTIEDHGYVTDGESIYKVDDSYDLVSNSYDIVFFEEEADEEANYVYDNRDKILKQSNFDNNYNIRMYNIGEIPSGFTASCAFTSEYFSVFVVENHFNVEFDSYSGSSNLISTNGKSKNYVSWAENLAFIILAKKNSNALLIDERFNYDPGNMVYYTKASNYYIAYLRVSESGGGVNRTIFSVNKDLNIAIAEIGLRLRNLVVDEMKELVEYLENLKYNNI